MQGQGHSRPPKVSPFTAIQIAISYNSTLEARKLIFSIYFHVIIIYKLYENCHT